MLERGGFVLQVVVIVLTLSLVGAIAFWQVRRIQQQQSVDRRKAMQVAEEGVLVALETLQRKPSWRTGIEHAEVDRGAYSVAIEPGDSTGTELLITAVGTSGAAQRTIQCRVGLVLDKGDSVWVERQMQHR